MRKTTEQQLTALFVQAMRTALAIIDEKAPAPRAKPARDLPTGIYHHLSKYNPYRAYAAHDGRSIYLGAFPTVAKAKAARKAFLSGKPVTTGSRVANRRAPLTLIKAA